jgi:hypothetical protein
LLLRGWLQLAVSTAAPPPPRPTIDVSEELARATTSGLRYPDVVVLRVGTLLLIALCACGRLGFGAGDDVVGDDVGGDGGGDSGNGLPSDSDGAGDPAGGNWTAFTPALPAAVDLYAVWAYAPNNIWVGGIGGAIYQFDGTSWNARPGPAKDVNTLWGSVANDLWEVGTLCEVRRWNGSAWTTVTVPGCTNASYFGIGGLSATDVWLVGVAGTIDHLVGTTWTALPQGSNFDLWSVWPVSASEAYVVGTKGKILHWTGTSFADESIGQNLIMSTVWASSTNDVWLAGQGQIYRKLNGGAWTPVTNPPYFVWWMFGRSANDIWAIGDAGSVLHYDGAQWTVGMAPVASTIGLRSMTSVPGGGLVMVGDGGTILAHP